MLRQLTIAACVAVVACSAAAQTMPFTGKITGTGVYVRSGSDRKYYEVTKLNAPAEVKVTGKEGGYYAIEPPKGVFSLISKQFVTKDGEFGTVKADRVRVRCGSLLRPTELSTVQGHLSTGDRIRIVGETEEYYKIEPPSGVKLYVAAEFITQAAAPAPAGGETTPPPADGGTTTMPEGTAPTNTTTVPRVTDTTGDAVKQAVAKLTEEYKKPLEQREMDKMLAMFKDIEVAEDDPWKSAIDYYTKFIEGGIARRQAIAQMRKILDDAEDQQARLEAERKRIRESQVQVPALTVYAAEGRLAPSELYDGSGGRPKRWVLRSDRTGQIVAYVQGTAGGPDLASHEGWAVGVFGSRRYDARLELYVVAVSRVVPLTGGEPKAPAKGAPPVAPTPKAGEPAPSSMRPDGSQEYVVQRDDTGLAGISKKFYGRDDLWPLITRANPDIDPVNLRPGQKLIIPPMPKDGSESAVPLPKTGLPMAPSTQPDSSAVTIDAEQYN